MTKCDINLSEYLTLKSLEELLTIALLETKQHGKSTGCPHKELKFSFQSSYIDRVVHHIITEPILGHQLMRDTHIYNQSLNRYDTSNQDQILK